MQNVIRNIVVLNQGEEVTEAMIPAPVSSAPLASVSNTIPSQVSTTSYESQSLSTMPGVRPLWEVEKEAIEQAIEFCEGNIPKAAALLDVSASTIYRKREKWQKE
jgi:two-component system repressor protein LuxO